jgi:hypothetical protein
MSNALARKKKRMQTLGYSKSELIGIQRHAKAQSNADYLIEESYYNVRMMAYQALHSFNSLAIISGSHLWFSSV